MKQREEKSDAGRTIQPIADRQSVNSRKEELVADDAREIHRQTHAEVQGNAPDTLATHRRAVAADDANQEAAALFDLLLVPALRRTAPLHAPYSAPFSRACGRSLGCRILIGSTGADQAKNYREYALSWRGQRTRIHRQRVPFLDSFWSAAIFRRFQ